MLGSYFLGGPRFDSLGWVAIIHETDGFFLP
jgi:hypothetical protein